MAWTDPSTHVWATGETVTAASMNTYIRLNLQETAPAVVAASGDMVYADGANSIARLAAGSSGTVLLGGSTPSFGQTIDGAITFNASDSQVRIRDSNSSGDTSDEWRVKQNNDKFGLIWFDDSLATSHTSLGLEADDFILHTGVHGSDEGAVVIATDTTPSTGDPGTSGTVVLSASVNTGGPAYVEILWSLRISRTSAASVSGLQILPREDGNNLEGAYSSTNTGIADIISSTSDSHTFFGNTFRRVTSADSSTYQIFVSADDASRFSIDDGHLYVRSIQYPT